MICAEFVIQNNKLRGFSITGHAGVAPAPHDILCAAVSAMSMLVVNTLREAIGVKTSIREDEEIPLLEVKIDAGGGEKAFAAEKVLLGFSLQLSDLEKQYPNHLSVRTKE